MCPNFGIIFKTYLRFSDRVATDLETFIEFTLNATTEFQYDGEIEGWEYSWTFSNSLLFTVSIMTMIGNCMQLVKGNLNARIAQIKLNKSFLLLKALLDATELCRIIF